MTENIFLKPYGTVYEVPLFDSIKIEYYKPAFKEGIKQQKAEIEAIVNNSEAPNFQNTVEAFEKSGRLLERVGSVFFNLLESNTNDEMQALAVEISPEVTGASDEVYMNDKLFAKIKTVHDNFDSTKFTTEQKALLKKIYNTFVRGGANLNAENKTKLKEINKTLSLLSLKFGDNVLAESNNYKLVIDKKTDLAGLPESFVSAAAEEATAAGLKDKWVFTVQKPSLIPFLTYAENRTLREQIFKAYTTRGNHNDSLDNKENVKQIVNLSLEKAKLLGFKTFADYSLEETMAKTPTKVNELVNNIMKRSSQKAKEELKTLQKLAASEGAKFKIEAWDWWYYTEKLRKKKYNLSEEDLKPYFKLENVRNGMFDVAHKLYGLNFKQNKEIPVMDKEAIAFEVSDSNNKVISILYMDFFPRPTKRSGAWMVEYRRQSRDEKGNNIIPIISLTTNFTKPSGDLPSLLTFEEVTTMFHEFGHCLHGMLSNCTYNRISSTEVPRDFVEMPSQIMENWASEPEVLKSFAKHYKTNLTIPDALIEKMQKTSTFNNGFTVTEFVAAAALDMKWYSITEPFNGNVNEFETKTMTEIGLIPEIVVRYRSTYYSHIFEGGYSAGYYSYLWTAVLDADAFAAFKETSLFDKKTANSLRTNILSKGGTDEVENMWLKFRGREPKVDFYLKRMGFE